MKNDPVRDTLRTLLRRNGHSMKSASVAIGRNQAYLYQYLSRGLPKVLKHRDAEALARLLNGSELRIVRVRGDSMQPVLSHGDRLLIDRHRPAGAGDRGAVRAVGRQRAGGQARGVRRRLQRSEAQAALGQPRLRALHVRGRRRPCRGTGGVEDPAGVSGALEPVARKPCY